MPHFYDTCAGPIEGLYLPPIAWEVLRRENIQTMDQLRANAGRLEQFPLPTRVRYYPASPHARPVVAGALAHGPLRRRSVAQQSPE